MKRVKKILRLVLFSIILLFAIILFIDQVVERAVNEQLYDTVSEVPYNRVGLLLGTNKMLTNGNINLYYQNRLLAAKELFKSEKIDFILVSGDNSSKYYNEPKTIRKDLIQYGIPPSRIFLDYAGFRTFDSVVRSKEVFGQNTITIISQPFHNKRAIFIANEMNIKAIGYNAKDVDSYHTIIREKFARVKMILDLLFGNQPKFLGKKIEIKE